MTDRPTAATRAARTGRSLGAAATYAWNRLARGIRVDAAPGFVVGCGHSGTSLLLAILGAHPRIHAIPHESAIATGDARRFARGCRRFDRWTIAAGKHRWIEKTPRHILHIGTILAAQPDARIVVIIRDGRDVAQSIQKRTGSLEEGIRRWVDDNRAAEPYWRHPQVHRVRYEDLITDFEPTVTRVVEFLGERYDPRMADYHRQPRHWYATSIAKPETAHGEHHNQHRNWQINQPIFDGRGRWKSLSAIDLTLIDRIAGPMLAEFGYDRPEPTIQERRAG